MEENKKRIGKQYVRGLEKETMSESKVVSKSETHPMNCEGSMYSAKSNGYKKKL